MLQLGARMGLVRPNGNAMPLAFAMAVPYWIVMVMLSYLAGDEPLQVSYLDIHVRLLVALPLLFAFESLFPMQVRRFAFGIASNGQLSPTQAVALRRTFSALRRWRRSVWPDLACLAIALLMALLAPELRVPGIEGESSAGFKSLTGLQAIWQLLGMTLFRFLLLRCLLLLGLWYWVLWRLSRLHLQLNASHADGVSGMAGLEVVHGQFVPLMLASASVLSASVAVDVAAGRMALPETFPILVGLVTVHALLFAAPLLLMTPALWGARVRGLSAFTGLSEIYARGFEKKWVQDRGDGDQMLGNSDFSGFIDLNSVVQGVRATKIFPLSRGMGTVMLAATLLPMVPLLLFKYPGVELVKQLVKRVAGL